MVSRGAAQHDPWRRSIWPIVSTSTRQLDFTPIHTFIAWSTLIISSGLLLFFIPGLSRHPLRRQLRDRPGAAVDDPADLHRDRLDLQPKRGEPRRAVRISALDGSSFFSDMAGFKWWQVYIAYGFLLTWNVIAMERRPATSANAPIQISDAKIA
jgi:hypothetical protein